MPRHFQQLAPLAGIAFAVGAATLGIGLNWGIADDPDRTLQDVAVFSGITDGTERSRALFSEMAKVITDPRCMNCHPMTRLPTQGDDMHPHMPPMNATDSGMGAAGITCGSCHRAENTVLVGSRIGSVPGNAHWSLAPASMGWQGQSINYICEQIKDPARNGNRSLADIQKHMAEDHLVAWAWQPGAGRRAAPGTHEQFGALVTAWIETGAACPQ